MISPPIELKSDGMDEDKRGCGQDASRQSFIADQPWRDIRALENRLRKYDDEIGSGNVEIG